MTFDARRLEITAVLVFWAPWTGTHMIIYDILL